MTQDIRVYLYSTDMNEKQKAAFMACVKEIDARGWGWRRSYIDGTFQVWSDGQLLGEGVTLDRALEESESAT